MIERALCPTVVGRDAELSLLEDALVTANHGESRFVALAGEAGLGKTRLASELASRARKLGFVVMWGGCSEADLALPYLPFVEAVGNYVSSVDAAALGEALGPVRRELAQLFPQLSAAGDEPASADPIQAKLRLFEAFVALVALPAREHGVVLVVEDIHWADSSTRELLDHLARRLVSQRTLVLVTYRSDELDRRHPVLPTLQGWRRSGLAETVKLEPLSAERVGEMIRAIFDTANVGPDFGDLMHRRTEGNPFVLEEMLKDAIDRGELFRTDAGWDRRLAEELGVPESVRDTILLRLARFEPRHVAVLQAAAVLGRSFEYRLLAEVAQDDELDVQDALAAAVGQQLLVEDAERPGRFRWRHALTQEAIYDDIVAPRRQAIHARAADALARSGSARAVSLANHLVGAGRFGEAVGACLAAAHEAELTAAFRETIVLLERVLPHVTDPHERARIVCRMGRASWLDGSPAAADDLLSDGIAQLEALGEEVEAAHYLIVRGRCRWELQRSEEAMTDSRRALEALEPHGASADLALAYMRIAGLHAFNLDYAGCVDAAERAVAIATEAGADDERVWARTFVALGRLGGPRPDEGFEAMDDLFAEAERKDYWWIAQNVTYNDLWMRVHTMRAGLEERVRRFERLPPNAMVLGSTLLSRAYMRHVRGDLAGSLADASEGVRLYGPLRVARMDWRGRVHRAQVLTELGRLDEAEHALPSPSTRVDVQDVVYDGAAHVRLALACGRIADALATAEHVLASRERVALYHGTLAVGVEAFVAAGLLEEARGLVETGRAAGGVASAELDTAEARILLADGDAGRAVSLLRPAVLEAERLGYALAALRARELLVAALARAGAGGEAQAELEATLAQADGLGARLLADRVRRTAAELGLSAPTPDERDGSADGEAALIPLGERLVTSLFADVRGYTPIVTSAAPADVADRLTTLYRWARADVERHRGVVDKFAGDAVMATFNVSGASLDHCVEALRAALALRDKAVLLDLQLGIGIAVGPAVVGQTVAGGELSVIGASANLAARLQAAASRGEILLSDEAYRRVERWLAEHAIPARRDELELKGFEGRQAVFRIDAPARERTAAGG